MCSWNIDAPDASATTSNLNHLMHISLPTGILKYIVYKRTNFLPFMLKFHIYFSL